MLILFILFLDYFLENFGRTGAFRIDFLINRSKVNRSVGNFKIIVAHKYSVLKSCGCKNTSVAFAVNIWQNINKLSVQTYGKRSAVE